MVIGYVEINYLILEYLKSFDLFTDSEINDFLNVKPIPLAISDATTSGAIDTFVKCVALEMPRGIRINSINPTVLEEVCIMKDMQSFMLT